MPGGNMSVDPLDAKQTAAQLISDAWQRAVEQGISSDLIASTALTAALSSLVAAHGRDATLRMADRLLEAVRAGRFDHADKNGDGVG